MYTFKCIMKNIKREVRIEKFKCLVEKRSYLRFSESSFSSILIAFPGPENAEVGMCLDASFWACICNCSLSFSHSPISTEHL